MRKDIVNRKRQGEKVIRELECGHFVEQPHGGKANRATTADCAECNVGAPPRVSVSGSYKAFVAGVRGAHE